MTFKTMTNSTKDPRDAFVESILVALARICDLEPGIDQQKLVFETLNALKVLNCGDLDGRVENGRVCKIDIFTPIIRCNGFKAKWDTVAAFLAIFSVHRQLQPLITETITSWYHLLPSQDFPSGRDNDSARRGFYSVVSQLAEISTVGSEAFEYLELDLGPSLVSSWAPRWLEWVQKGKRALSDVDMLDEADVDFYIATRCEELVDLYVHQQEKGPLWYFVDRICLRMAQFQDYIPHSFYTLIAQSLTPGQSDLTDLSFAFQVVMEVVDHPESNFFETPHLALLLSNALKQMEKVPCHILHSTLSCLASVQSLPALLNMTQYLLAKFLINTCETVRLMNMKSQIDDKPGDGNWYKSKTSLFQIPLWFEKSILPPIPPISRSSFVFQGKSKQAKESCSLQRVTELLFNSLKSVGLISGRVLQEYQALGINPVQINTNLGELPSGITHRLEQSFLELYFIPIATTLLLSRQLITIDIKLIDQAKAHVFSRLLLLYSVKNCEKLLLLHGSSCLFYLIEFANKISLEDLALQNISIDLLNHLFFHSENNFVKQLCEDSVLAKRSLLEYISLWNDGTETYENFFAQVFKKPQPNVEAKLTTLDDLIMLLPDSEEILAKKSREVLSKAQTNKPAAPHIPQEREYDLSSNQQNKFDPYTAMPFIPAEKPTRSLVVNANNKAISHGFPSNNLDNHNFNAMNAQYILTPNMLNNSHELSFTGTNEYITNDPSAEKFSFDLSSSSTQLSATPRTPNLTTSSLFNSPWNDSPDMHSTPTMCNMVSTGKNYILGGHNRVRNNSRAQSIHIDSFGNESYRI